MFDTKTMVVAGGSAIGGIVIWESGFFVARKINKALENRRVKKEAAKAAESVNAATEAAGATAEAATDAVKTDSKAGKKGEAQA